MQVSAAGGGTRPGPAGGKKGAGAAGGAGASSMMLALEQDWIAEHGRQVARMLPGGACQRSAATHTHHHGTEHADVLPSGPHFTLPACLPAGLPVP